ncbi:cold-shock protein [Pseudomonas proteolytica]|uniref:Cold-shock protein n=1 Tax=Pseudomonas proteolytica TaxID=219574 RepID=A0AAW5AJD3_9PSED|nr:cold-shock protein [Pseudomonas proteolytica]KAA8698971.1 cold-shock protein [Pseudomonas proteolytica]MCF5060286.1 cold-shock protein [Pseudomonas proteolytica]MCF5103617.1 cold-shock protein [Pseudomonas proteolytica]TWR82664.1 cold-shock protein [Pseudomonas proteolytica]SED97182.1 cold-shock DNA-binding protein family [Pseudomonas proteolytica]
MATGTVKLFDELKGFGFITPDGGGEHLFVHFSGIASSGYRALAEGQKVEFNVIEGPKGKQAVDVKPL